MEGLNDQPTLSLDLRLSICLHVHCKAINLRVFDGIAIPVID